MMRVILEIVPRGDESRKFVAGILEISNDTTGDTDTGNYDARITGPVADGDGAVPNEPWGEFRLEGFERKRGWWSCVKEALIKFNTDYETP